MMKTTFLALLIVILMGSCKKESFITSSEAEISVSDNHLEFDTIFTSTGSATHYFRIYNRNDRKLRISKIALGGGSNSFFRINADGMQGPTVTDLEMEANDSLYVFVTVMIDPTTSDLPFIIQDSINIAFNGNEEWVQLSAWGQNANFLRSHVISSDTSWTNEKPVVITGGALVVQGVTLTIQKGTKIYLHADAPLLVEGTLKAEGEKYDSTKIVFQGDRLDKYYKDLPGSWPGIYFRESSSDNLLRHVIIKNAYQGIVCENPSSNADPKLILDAGMIDNCYDAGILGVNTSITATNCLISNCGKNIVLVQGGDYQFDHCTDVAISNTYISHKDPVLALTDFIKKDDVAFFADTKAKFINCIFWGSNGTVDDEVVVIREGDNNFQVEFNNCLWKLETTPLNISSSGIIPNSDPMFREVESAKNRYDFRLKEGSPAINAGLPSGVQTDLEGTGRTNIPDIGAYESAF